MIEFSVAGIDGDMTGAKRLYRTYLTPEGRKRRPVCIGSEL